MNRNDLINAVAEKCDFTKKDVHTVMDALRDTILETLPNEEIVIMQGLVLTTKETKERECRNPQTGAKIMVPAHKQPKAKFGKAIKDALN